MHAIWEIFARGWENFLARPGGQFSLRFVLQPVVAALIALRAGLKDAREDRPAFLWAAFSNAAARRQLLQGGWKDIRMPFLVAVVLDAAYQFVTHRSIYPLELLFTATLLALLPYTLLRGPINRVARRFIHRAGGDAGNGHRS
jgi:hypothetical protein